MIKKIALLFSSIAILFTTDLSGDQYIKIEKNRVYTLQIDEPVKEIYVANPEVADVQMNTPPYLYITGRKAGSTSIIITPQKGPQIKYDITCSHQIGDLKATLSQLFPDEDITVRSLPMGISLNGIASSAKMSKDVEIIATQYIEAGEKVINNMSLGGSSQVMLKVKIAEVQRTVLNTFNLNMGDAFKHAPKHFTWGLLTGNAPTVPAAVDPTTFARTTNGSIGARIDNDYFTAAALLDLLDQENLGTVLAEPNLIALSGETASFLVGGEYPFPTPQSDGSITIDFKKVGISLSFSPTVLSSNLINLRVVPEVSQIDTSNTVSIVSTNGTTSTVPSIKTRRAETSVELSSGQSLAIAGLIQSNITNQLIEYPGLADLPILGALFRSTKFNSNQTELVIIVTPYLVEPNSPDKFAVPTDQVNPARPLEMLLERRLNHQDDNDYTDRTSDQEAGHLYGDSGFYIE